jgi:transcription elongation GreA/GreB family factor
VGVGSRVTLRHTQTGQLREVCVLGPWEADAAKNILNYKAPLAQTMMGARCGDTVELSFTGAPGTYTVESLGNALLE